VESKPERGVRPGIATLREGAVLALLGWAGIAALVNFTEPFLFPRWLLFFGLVVALTGTALPIAWYLNRRFSPERFPADGVLWREAMEVSGLVTLQVWLQVGRILNAALGWIFFIVFLAVEILLRIYENSRWVPSDRIGSSAAAISFEESAEPQIDSTPDPFSR
jgi:hypothetical protein